MKIKYIHFATPETEKIYDTKKAFNNPANPRVFKTQLAFDSFELKKFAEDKKKGIIISYVIVKEESK